MFLLPTHPTPSLLFRPFSPLVTIATPVGRCPITQASSASSRNPPRGKRGSTRERDEGKRRRGIGKGWRAKSTGDFPRLIRNGERKWEGGGLTYCGTIRRKKSNIYRFLGGENVSRADRSSVAENERGDASRSTTRPRGKRGRIYI